MVKKSRKNIKRRGGMIAKAASTIAQTAALEYAQRRGPQIIKHAIESPDNLKDPSIFLTGKKSPTENKPNNFNATLLRPTPVRINSIPVNSNPNVNIPNKSVSQMMFTPINDENYNPNIMRGGRTKRHKKRSRKSRKRRY